ncbi:fungal-specific transcription factor domain-containing protein, partial [Dactylonectria macrodidyma]
VHLTSPKVIRWKDRLAQLNSFDVFMLHQKRAFLFPPRPICDELVELFFTWVHPTVPVIDRCEFMLQYQGDAGNHPSPLLLHAILLAGSRFSKSSEFSCIDCSTAARLSLYERAEALYDADYELNSITIVQALILIAWYWEFPAGICKSAFYWIGAAITVAVDSGTLGNLKNTNIAEADRRVWKRIWWALFTRDRFIAMALDQPAQLNFRDVDLDELTDEDFREDLNSEAHQVTSPIHIHFFLQYTRLYKIMDSIIGEKSPLESTDEAHGNRPERIKASLRLWLHDCLISAHGVPQRHQFWDSYLYTTYYTVICYVHRVDIRFSDWEQPLGEQGDSSVHLAAHAADMITEISWKLLQVDELSYLSALPLYSLSSALMVYASLLSASALIRRRESILDKMRTCANILRHISSVWQARETFHPIVTSILSCTALKERRQRSLSRHK